MGAEIRKFSKKAAGIICVSDAVKKSMLDAGAQAGKLVTIHNGISFPPAGVKNNRKKIRRRYGIKNEMLAGTVGFFRRNKGFDVLIRAASIAAGENPEIKFIIVGGAEPSDKDYEESLKRSVKDNGLSGRVIFTGFQDRFKYMPAFDFFVLPSEREPFGLVTVEAGAMGLPVAAFNTGGTKEIIKNNVNGILAKDKTPVGLAGAIITLASDRKKTRMIGREAARQAARFSIKGQSGRVRELIEKLIKDKNK